MRNLIAARRLAALLLCGGLAACASPDPVPYTGLASSAYLRPNRHDDTGRIPYSYTAAVNWGAYSKVIVEPVSVYQGRDQQFDDLSETDKTVLANHMQREFTRQLQSRFMPANGNLANTLRIRLTLTGAAENTPVLGTLSRFDLAGGLYNGVQAVRGREGTMTGSVIYAVEIYDAASMQLLGAFIAKQYPGVYDLGAGMGALAAAKAGIDKGARELVAQLS